MQAQRRETPAGAKVRGDDKQVWRGKRVMSRSLSSIYGQIDAGALDEPRWGRRCCFYTHVRLPSIIVQYRLLLVCLFFGGIFFYCKNLE